MTIIPEDYTALTGLSFTSTSIFLPRDGEVPSEKTIRECISVELGVKVKKYGGRGISYSLLDLVLMEGRPSGTSARLYARIFYLLFLSSTILSNRSKRVDPWLTPLVPNLSEMGSFCWGEPAYANLINHMSVDVRVLDGPDRPVRPISPYVVSRLVEVRALFYSFGNAK